MGQGSSSRRRNECIPDHLKKLVKWTDDFFRKGDLREAMALAETAWISFPSFREAQRARAAIIVHLAAADLGQAADHHFVQGISARTFLRYVTRGEVGRTELWELLDPAKSLTRSTAAAAAYQLIVDHKDDGSLLGTSTSLDRSLTGNALVDLMP